MIDFDEIIPQINYFVCRHCSENWIIEESIIDFIDITYIIQGKGKYIIDDVTYEVKKGDLLCIPKNSKRYAKSDPNDLITSYAINFLLYDLQQNDVSLPFPLVSKIDIKENLLSLYHDLDLEWLSKKPGYGIKVRGIVLLILSNYFDILYYKNSCDNFDLRIKKAIRYILENYASTIEVKDLAALVKLNQGYFGGLFKKCTGCTVKEYVNRIRINNAENMLSSGEFSVHEAAQRCGFDDIFYFSKVFKSLKSYSPSKVICKHM